MDIFWSILDNTIAIFALIALLFIWPIEVARRTKTYRVVMGCVLSVMALFIMLNSVHVGDGLYIDARYAIPIIAIIFFGITPGTMTIITIIIVRIYILGGDGAPIGVLYAIIQGIVVMGYKKYYYDKKNDPVRKASLKLLVLSLFLQLILTSLPLLFFPFDIAVNSIKANAIYLLTIYPIIVFVFSLVVGYRIEYFNYKAQKNERNSFFEMILHKSSNPIALLDENGVILHVNEAWAKESGNTVSDLLTIESWLKKVSPDYNEGVLNKFTHSECTDTCDNIFDLIIKTEKNNFRTWNIECNQAGVLADGKKYYVYIGKDITKRIKNENKLMDMSYKDFLTGLFNRRYYDEVYKVNVHFDKEVLVLYADLNDLKSVNDYYGHSKGDEAIAFCAEALKDAFKKDSTLFRFGGDEFMIVTEGINKQECVRRLDTIDNILENAKFGNVNIGISLGIHELDTAETLDDAITKAESRMYEYKLFESTSARSGTVDVILTMLFEKDPDTEKHSKRVQDICRVFSKELDLNTNHVSLLLRSALLHDIGKILIPTSIILSTEKLTDSEFVVIKNHSYLGHRILSANQKLRDIANVILSHHERIDGFGYPNNIKGEEIPYLSRILSIVDSYEAMTSVRPYSAQMSSEDAREELIRCSGTQFDSDLVKSFIKIIPKLNNINL